MEALGTRLLRLRGDDAGSLARRAGVADADVAALVAGHRPDPPLLRTLAPALGLHASDLFIVAGRPVPDDLAPLDPDAADHIGRLPWSVT